jgi:[ribosomal protein S5]-alanine N-acetyltransferase
MPCSTFWRILGRVETRDFRQAGSSRGEETMHSTMREYATARLMLRSPHIHFSQEVNRYLVENEAFLSAWEPKRDTDYYRQENIDQSINQQILEMEEKKGVYVYIFLKETNALIGKVGISNIIYGPFLSCFLGYKLSERYINNGYMTEALQHVTDLCFHDLNLHRIEANVVPRNFQSKRVLEKLGFTNEGLSKKYLKINGVWEDHEHYVLLNGEVE